MPVLNNTIWSVAKKDLPSKERKFNSFMIAISLRKHILNKEAELLNFRRNMLCGKYVCRQYMKRNRYASI